MKWINPDQLLIELNEKIKSVYILYGNDLFLLQKAQSDVFRVINKLQLVRYVSFEINLDFCWNQIFNICKIQDLFTKHKILSLNFSQNYPIILFNKNIQLLSKSLHQSITLIICIHTAYYITTKNIQLPLFFELGTFVICNTPKNDQLMIWIKNEAKNMQLTIEELALQLLCYYYEDNVMLLQQTLQHLSWMYADDKVISFMRVKKIVQDVACLNVYHWIESIFIGSKKRSSRILQKLVHTGFDLKKLLYILQKEILILIDIKYSMIHQISTFYVFKQHKIYSKYHQNLLLKAAKRLNLQQLYKLITLLAETELKNKGNYEILSTSIFELFIIILCN